MCKRKKQKEERRERMKEGRRKGERRESEGERERDRDRDRGKEIFRGSNKHSNFNSPLRKRNCPTNEIILKLDSSAC